MESEQRSALERYSFHILKLFGVLSQGESTGPFRRYSWRVASTAIHFFWKYFSLQHHSCEDTTVVVLASLFLAGKLEGSFIKAQSLINLVENSYSDKQINDAERKLIEVLTFDIHVEHSQCLVRSLLGMEWRQFAQSRCPTVEQLHQWTVTVIDRSCYLSFLLQATGVSVEINPLQLAVNVIAFSIATLASELTENEQLSSLVDLFLREKVGDGVVENARATSQLIREIVFRTLHSD